MSNSSARREARTNVPRHAAPPQDAARTLRIRDQLAGLPRLGQSNATAAISACKVCGAAAPFFDVVDFNKCANFYPFGPSGVSVSYFRCDNCGFLFTPLCDDWSHGDFQRLIYNDDYVLLDPEYLAVRPHQMAERMARQLQGFEDARILDYGAGQGLFAELMAQRGFPRVESYDPFSIPSRPTGQFDIVTCFEVIEHSPSPMQTLTDMLAFLNDQGCIVLGEALQPPDIDRVRCNWWYVAPRNGHVSTFADRTLVALADRCGLVFHRGEQHAFVRGSHFAELGERFGNPLACFRPGAPGESRFHEWHAVETTRTIRFQWTATDALRWHLTSPPGPARLIQVMVPFTHESEAGFAARCQIEINGCAEPTTVRESCVFAESTEPMRGAVTVTLRTPPPSAHGDRRSIGLAIDVVG